VDRTTQLSLYVARPKIKVAEHLQRSNIQTYVLCTFTFSLQTCTIFFRINAIIDVYYNFLTFITSMAITHPVPDRVKPSFVIFDIRAL